MERGEGPQISKAFGHKKSENKMIPMMGLTVWEQLEREAAPQIELLQSGQLPEAFGHHISKIRNKSEVIGDLLAGRLPNA